MAEIQQVDVARLAWVDMNNGTETIFKPTDCNISRVALKPSSPILILVYMYYTTQSQSTDMPLIVGRYSTDIWHSLYWLSVDWCIGQHIGRSTRGRVSADISIDMSIWQSRVD